MTTQTSAKVPRFGSWLFANTAIACFVYSLFVLLLMHVLRPDYTPASHMISDYGVGRYGWMMATAFLAMSGGCLMLMLGLVRSGPASGAARFGTLLLGIASIGLVVSAIFPTDLEEATSRTQTGNIHDISFLVNVGSLLLATTVLSASFGRHPRWRPYRRTSITLTSLVVVAFVLQFITLHRGAPYGLTNRFFVAVLFAWFLATAIRLRKLERE